MKKLLSFMLIVLSAFVLVACGPSQEEKDTTAVQEAFDGLAVADGVIANFDVPTVIGEVAVEWTATGSLSKGTEANNSLVILVSRQALDSEGTLVATLTKGAATQTKTFNLTVRGTLPDASEADVKAFAQGLSVSGRAWSNFQVPVISTAKQIEVTWTSSDASIVNVSSTGNAVVTRPATTKSAKLVATVVGGDHQIIREFFVQVYGNEINVDGVYNVAFTDTTEGLNPLNTTSAAAGDVSDYLVDTLYSGDYDWADAIAKGYAAFPGDFSKIRSDRNPTGTVEMPSIRYIQGLQMASGFPVSAKTGTDFSDGYGLIDIEASKTALDKEWTITLKPGLKFADGTPINAETYDYSFRQYLDPKLLNARANYLYTGEYVPLLNGAGYFGQGKAVKDKLGFDAYVVDGKNVHRAYSFDPEATETVGYDYYRPANAQFANYWVENWGTAAAPSWTLVDITNATFKRNAAGEILAPKAGMKDANGNDLRYVGQADAGDTVSVGSVTGILPAFFTDNGAEATPRYTRAAVTEAGIPVNGTQSLSPEVAWSEVGFEIVDALTFKLTLTQDITQWDLMSNLGIVNLVHPAKYESGKNAAGTLTTYGSVTNPLVSYGPYTLLWEDGQKFTFTRNELFHKKEYYTIKTINGPVIETQTAIINEFKANRVDVAGVSGEYWSEFQDHPNLYISPSNSFYRLAISLDRNGTAEGIGTGSPILQYPEFRRALYLATDRNDFANDVLPPSQGALGYLSNIHQVTEDATNAYAASSIFRAQLEELGLSPNTGGYNRAEAKSIFDTVYAKAVADGKIAAGQKAVIEFSYADSGSNPRIAAWVKAQYEEVFGTTNFEVKLVPLASAAFTAARDSGNFDLTFTGMSGATFDAMFGMYYIFSRTYSTFLVGAGHNTGSLAVEAELLNLFDLILEKAPADRTEADNVFLEALNEQGEFTGTFDELAELAATLSSYADYDGKQQDMENVTAAFEKALLSQMIAVPLFSSTSAAVYSDRIIRVSHAYHLFLGWGGLTYTHIKA